MSDLIANKKTDPSDTSNETHLRIFKTLPKVSVHETATCTILGLFRRNFAPLSLHIHVASASKTIPIKEPILQAIYNDAELATEHRLILDSIAYVGGTYQRVDSPTSL